MKRLFSILLLTFVALQTVCSQNEKQIDWKTDLDYLSKELSAKHYHLFAVKSEKEFLSGINTVKLNCNQMSGFQIAIKVQQLIAKMGDAHTRIYFNRLIDKNQILPIHLFWTNDGLHILHTISEYKELLGCKLLSINDVPVQTVIDSLSTILTVDNQSVVKSSVPSLIPVVQILKYFGFADNNQVKLGLETDKGQFLQYTLESSEMNRYNRVSFKPDSIAFCIKNEKAFFTDFYFRDDKIFYVLYNKCWSKEIELENGNKDKAETMPSFNEFETRVFNTLQHNPVDKIIVDLRFNEGGNSSQGTAFIEKMAKFLDKNPRIKIYVIIGRETFSSAILNAMDFKRLTKAVFVGEETAGKPNHFGEVRSFQLPTSDLSVSYSTKYFKNSDENLNTIKPDVPIEMSFFDFRKGIDPVYEWIKKQ